jgi:hypothetical protein
MIAPCLRLHYLIFTRLLGSLTLLSRATASKPGSTADLSAPCTVPKLDTKPATCRYALQQAPGMITRWLHVCST